MNTVSCINCRTAYPDTGTPYKCPRCGGIYDFTGPFHYDPGEVDDRWPGIWRYLHAFGLPQDAPIVTLGEGHTPLVWGQAFGMRLAFKCEHQNPTGSFKDRGNATLVSFVHSRGVETAIEDSSGNAGASFSAYAARAGIKARVFIPESASGPKRQQIEAYGAEVVLIPGPRSNASDAVRQEADAGVAYASHAYLPFNLPGYATAAYEIVEQLGGAPGSVIMPVGQGGFLLGMIRGFEALQAASVIESFPVFVGVQARACAPLWALSVYGPAGIARISEGQTVAEGIRVTFPLRGDALMQSMNTHQGMIVAVSEEEILQGQAALARGGLYVEPTSAVVWGALGQVAGQIPEPVVLMLTGTGLKWLKT